MNKLNTFLILSIFIWFIGCNGFLHNKTEDNAFRFLILSDIHVSDNQSHGIRLNSFVEKFNNDKSINANIDFVCATGDNVSYIYSNSNVNRDSLPNNKLRYFINTVSRLKVPYQLCMGNHEYKIDKNRDADGYFPESEILELEKIWKKETGLDTYYSIKKGNFNLLFLNSNRGRYQNKFFGSIQMKWIEKQLANSKNVILFFHHPMRTDNISNWYKKRNGTMTKEVEPEFYALLKENKDKIKAIFVGHGHKWMHDKLFNSIKVYETSSFGDNEAYMYYKVVVDNGNVQVAKSVEQPDFKGFTKFKN